jgi:hypothetical protein
VTFCIWAVNTSPYTSAFNVILDDMLPQYMSYVNGGQGNWAGNSAGATIQAGYRNSSMASGWGAEPVNGQAGPNYWAWWKINWIGPSKSAMMCFKMVIQ